MGNIINYLYYSSYNTTSDNTPLVNSDEIDQIDQIDENSNTTKHDDLTKNTDTTTNDSTESTDVENKFKEQDLNNDNDITWEEFDKAYTLKYGKECSKNNLWKFLAMDSDGSASVSLSEWNKYHSSSSWS